MKFRKILLVIVAIFMAVSLCSCVEEESEETLAMPPLGSMIEYRISDTEYIRVLQDGTNVGEWVCGDDIRRIAIDFEYEYWGILFSRWGVTEMTVVIYELEDIDRSQQLNDASPDKRYYPEYGDVLATLDEGLLNSTQVLISGTEEKKPILKTTVIENYSGFFNWTDPAWAEFCKADDDFIYELENISLSFSSVTGIGEWTTNGVAVPIRVAFDDILCFMEIYDISEEEKRIFAGNGYMSDGRFVIDEFNSTMFYENTVTEITVLKIPAAPSTDA